MEKYNTPDKQSKISQKDRDDVSKKLNLDDSQVDADEKNQKG